MAEKDQHRTSRTPLKNCLGPGVSILEARRGLYALEKPEGIRSHPNKDGQTDRGALLALPYDRKRECYIAAAGEGPQESSIFLLNRLDSPTSGIIMVSTDPEQAAEVQAAFAKRTVTKVYLAVVQTRGGSVRSPWKDRVTPDGRAGAGRKRGPASERTALTYVRVVRSSSGPLACCLLQLEPKTGRTHQLRIQCQQHHVPIIGDATYGNFALNRDVKRKFGVSRLCLHAHRIEIPMAQGAPFSATSPEPPEFSKLLSGRQIPR